MEDSSLDPTEQIRDDILPAFLESIHTLIKWGYEDGRNKIQSNNEEEPSITGFIAESIHARLCALDCERWCKYYAIKEDAFIATKGRIGKARLKPDIIIENTIAPRPTFTFEAKRLSKNNHKVDKYIAFTKTGQSGGLGCFIDGSYAKEADEAGMLGYIQSEDSEYWKNKIKRAIVDTNALELKSQQLDFVTAYSFPLEWTSEHNRPNSSGRPIMIYHILLDCTPLSKEHGV